MQVIHLRHRPPDFHYPVPEPHMIHNARTTHRIVARTAPGCHLNCTRTTTLPHRTVTAWETAATASMYHHQAGQPPQHPPPWKQCHLAHMSPIRRIARVKNTKGDIFRMIVMSMPPLTPMKLRFSPRELMSTCIRQGRSHNDTIKQVNDTRRYPHHRHQPKSMQGLRHEIKPIKARWEVQFVAWCKLVLFFIFILTRKRRRIKNCNGYKMKAYS
jgi:hypothetical protein